MLRDIILWIEPLIWKISKLKEHCVRIGRNLKEIECSILVSCLVGHDGNVINNILLNQREKQADAMQQAREAENASLVGWPEL
jgi:hypothetical protein